MEYSCRKVKSSFPKTYAEFFVRKKGFLLEIGSRGSTHRLRIYEKKKSLEFELETKKTTIQSYQDFLFSENLENFEDNLVKHYYKQLKKWLALDSCYISWLLVGLRKLVSLERSALPSAPYTKPKSVLVSSYLNENNLTSLVQKEQFFQLIQFLSFL